MVQSVNPQILAFERQKFRDELSALEQWYTMQMFTSQNSMLKSYARYYEHTDSRMVVQGMMSNSTARPFLRQDTTAPTVPALLL
jgi:hypothetical protein